MTKLKTPILSLGAHGTLSGSVTFQRRFDTNFARMKPKPTDLKTLAQIYQRWDYQDYIAQWQSLTPAEKLFYRKEGSKLRLPAFSYFMSLKLNALPDLAGRWHLDELSGTTAFDSSKNSNHGTFFGTSPATGLIDNCRYFDGLDDSINCGKNSSLDLTNNLSLLAFIRRHREDVPESIISKSINAGWEMLIGATNQLSFIGGSPAWVRSTLDTILKDQWYHVAVVVTSTKCLLYINGELSRFHARGDITTNPRLALIGARTNSTAPPPVLQLPFKGDIDEVKVYNQALSASDIKRHAERRYPL